MILINSFGADLANLTNQRSQCRKVTELQQKLQRQCIEAIVCFIDSMALRMSGSIH